MTDEAKHSSTDSRKRSRAAVLVEPFQRQLYELIVQQLHHDGFVSAAATVADAAGVCLGGEESYGVNGDRLSQLASDGILMGASQRREMAEGRMLNVVERFVSLSKLYVPLHLSNAYQVGSKVRQWRLKFSSAALGGVIRDVSLSSNGSYASCAGTNGLALIFCLRTLQDLMTVESARSSNHSNGLEWPSRDSSAPVHNANEITSLSVARTISGHSQSVEVIRFHPERPIVASGDRGGDLLIHNISPPNVKMQLKVHDQYPIRTISWHPSGEYILFGTDHPIPRLLSVRSDSEVFMPTHSHGDSAAIGGSEEVDKHYHSAGLTSVVFSSDGRTWASSSLDGSWVLWDGVSGRAIQKVNAAHSSSPVTSVAYSRTGNFILSGGMDSTARLWDLRKLPSESSTEHPGTWDASSSPQFHGEVMSFGMPGKCEHRSIRAAFSADESHVLFQSADLTMIHAYCVYTGAVSYVMATEPALLQRGFAVSPFGSSILTGGDDCRLRLWSSSLVPCAS